jgi:hypothetical protein
VIFITVGNTLKVFINDPALIAAGAPFVRISVAVFSVAAMPLWNALMPDIFGLPALNYWQAAGIVVLARILFGGLGSGLSRPHGGYGRFFHRGNQPQEKRQPSPF